MNQPVSVAMKPRGKEAKIDQSSQRCRSSPPLSTSQLPSQAIASISMPQPTMIRKVKKGIATGGRSAGAKSVMPVSLAVRLIEPIRLPR